MSASPEEIFEEVVEQQFNICRRCFKPSQPESRRDSLDGGLSCGEDCGALSATLEEEPIERRKIEARAPRLLSLVQKDGYEVDEDVFREAIDILADLQEPPRSIFVDAVRAGRGEADISELMNSHGIESEEVQRTRDLLGRLPCTGISEEELEEIDDRVASGITTVADSHRPGSNVYYISSPKDVPDEYPTARLGNRFKEVMRVVVEENEGWFWRVSADAAEDWLEELNDEFGDYAASCLFQYIRSRQRYTLKDSPSPEEQFRRTCLWPILKKDAEQIMGFLRRHDDPQSLESIAEYVGRSESTVRTVLTVLQSATRVSSDASEELWRAVGSPDNI